MSISLGFKTTSTKLPWLLQFWLIKCYQGDIFNYKSGEHKDLVKK